MDFKGKTLDDIIKIAEVEVLLSSIDISDKGTVVKPVKCPAIGRKDNYLQNMNGDPMCIMGDKNCPYFKEASFHLEDYSKRIMCDAINLEDIKGR